MPARPHLEPIKHSDVRRLIKDILENGDFEFSAHALEEMQADKLETTDCLNILRGGTPGGAEYINGEWRYRVCTRRMCVVITFLPKSRLRVITTWRNQE